MRHTLPFLIAATAGLASTGSLHAQTVVTVSGGQLSLTSLDGDQNVRIEVGPLAGQVLVYGFPGIPDATAYSGISSVVIKTGAGNDQVAVDAQTPANFTVAIDAGAGELSNSVQWNVLPSAVPVTSRLSLVAVPGPNQFSTIVFDNDAQFSTIAVDSRAATEVSTSILSVDPTTRLNVVLGGAAAKTTLGVESRAAVLNVTSSGAHADVQNQVLHSIKQLDPGIVNLRTNIRLGNVQDLLEYLVAAPGSNVTVRGQIRGAGGNDLLLVKAEAATVTSGLVIGGEAGSDELVFDVLGGFQLTPAFRTQLLGGTEDDLLTLQTDSAILGSGLPNDQVPLIDGGPGFDLYKAFGEIVNCEGTF